MSKTILLAACSVAMFILSGCGDRSRTASGSPVDQGANPNVLVQEAVETRTTLSSLAGKGVMRIVDQPTKFGLTVNADVVADDSSRLRIKADKLAGAIQAFDVVMLGDDIGFYVPTQKTLYHGKVNELQNFAFRFDPEEVLQQMLRPETYLLAKRWRYADDVNAKNVVVLDEDVAKGRPRLRVAISKRHGMITSIAQLDREGKPVFVKRFDDYRSLSRGRRGENVTESESVFPYLMAFSWPRERRSMEMQFKQIDPNARVYDEDFDIAASADTQYRPLQEAEMDIGDEPVAARPREPTSAAPL
ncbi:MAG: hypothetical protein LUG50_03185 [Planctomycetaceae bacterium]|nr:hypothetical protein [Planctomycetaceae bacterium]